MRDITEMLLTVALGGLLFVVVVALLCAIALVGLSLFI